MKSRTVILLWIIAIALGLTAYFVKFGKSEQNITRTKLAPGDKIIPNLPIRDITKVTLNAGSDTTTLLRLDDQQWGVVERDNYAVNYELLRNLLGALSELEVTQGYPASKAHYSRFGLSWPSGKDEAPDENPDQALRVTLTGKSQSAIETIFLGKYSGTTGTGGRFIRIGSDDTGVYAVGETFPGVSSSPRDWLNKDFLKIDQIKSISVSAPADPGFKPWQLDRQAKPDGTPNPTGQFMLAGMAESEVMELTSTNQLRNLFSYSGFQDILNKQELSTTSNPDEKLKRQATITTYDGLTYELEFWPQKDKAKDPNADDRLPPVGPSYLLTIRVHADIPEQRSPEKDESQQKPEVIKSREAEFERNKKSLQEKLGTAQNLVGRIFQVSQSTVSPLLKKRSDFVRSKDKPGAATPPAGFPGNSANPLSIPLQPRR